MLKDLEVPLPQKDIRKPWLPADYRGMVETWKQRQLVEDPGTLVKSGGESSPNSTQVSDFPYLEYFIVFCTSVLFNVFVLPHLCWEST
jgi:hypothetical protein